MTTGKIKSGWTALLWHLAPDTIREGSRGVYGVHAPVSNVQQVYIVHSESVPMGEQTLAGERDQAGFAVELTSIVKRVYPFDLHANQRKVETLTLFTQAVVNDNR